jgi:hypothetical protein
VPQPLPAWEAAASAETDSFLASFPQALPCTLPAWPSLGCRRPSHCRTWVLRISLPRYEPHARTQNSRRNGSLVTACGAPRYRHPGSGAADHWRRRYPVGVSKAGIKSWRGGLCRHFPSVEGLGLGEVFLPGISADPRVRFSPGSLPTYWPLRGRCLT